jgi:hypothetical protein
MEHWSRERLLDSPLLCPLVELVVESIAPVSNVDVDVDVEKY